MTIGCAASLLIITLVVGLAYVEGGFGLEQGVHLIAHITEYLHNVFGCLLLRFVAIEYATAILRTDVGTYTVGLCRVVNLEEQHPQAKMPTSIFPSAGA